MRAGRRTGLAILALLAAACARAAETSAPPDLATLLAEAAERSPAVRAARARLAAAERVPAQMEALPDPLLEASYTNEALDDLTLGSSPDSNLTVRWTQDLPYPGKRRAAGDVARAEAGVAASTVEIARVEALARVKAAWVEIRRVERVRALLAENRRVLEALRDLARVRFENGRGILESALRAGAEIARLDAEVAALDGERRRAEAELGAALGRAAGASFGPAAETPVEAPYDAEALARDALERSPRVAAFRALTLRDGTRVEAAQRGLRPDFMWTASYAHRGGLDPMVMGGFGVRLPLFRNAKQSQAVVQAERDLEASRAETEGAGIESAAAVRALLSRIEAVRAHHVALEQAVLPQARAALDAARAAWESGAADFPTVLDDMRALLADARALEDLEADRLRALTALEPLTGRSLLLPAGATP